MYAHNILWRDDAAAGGGGGGGGGGGRKRPHRASLRAAAEESAAATAKLSDFGAAFYYGGLPAEQRPAFERMEARAFGLLLEELLERHDGAGSDALLAPLREAAAAATRARPEERPGFSALARMLAGSG